MELRNNWVAASSVLYSNEALTQTRIVSNFSSLLDLSRMPDGATESKTTATSTLPSNSHIYCVEGSDSFVGTLQEIGFVP